MLFHVAKEAFAVGGWAPSGPPLSAMAARKRESLRPPKANIWEPTLIAPADWPQIVTLDGSPPKASMFSYAAFSICIKSLQYILSEVLLVSSAEPAVDL